MQSASTEDGNAAVHDGLGTPTEPTLNEKKLQSQAQRLERVRLKELALLFQVRSHPVSSQMIVVDRAAIASMVDG